VEPREQLGAWLPVLREGSKVAERNRVA